MSDTAAQDTSRRTALIVVCCTSFITPLMLSGVNVAIPAIAETMQADAVLLSWIPTAFLLTTAVFLLPAGKLGDILGRRKMYITGMVIVTLGSLLAALAGNIHVLIAGRFVQGLGTSLIATSGLPMLISLFPANRRGSVVGLTTSCVYFGLTGGPLIGGLCTDYLSWRALFVVHVPVVLVLFWVTLTRLQGEWTGESERRLDLAGAVLFGAGISALVYGLTKLPNLYSLGLILPGLALLTGFFQYEKRLSDPLLDVRLIFENRLFLFSILAALLLYSASYGLSYLMSLYLQYIQGLSAKIAGLVLVAQPIMMALLTPFTGRLSDRIEPRLLATAGLLLNITGYALLSLSDADTSLLYIILCLLTTGTGFALFSSPNMNAIFGAVGKGQLGTASGITNTVRVVGQMFSMAIITVVFAMNMGKVRITPELHPLLMDNISFCLGISALLAALAMLSSSLRGNMHKESRVRGQV
ncbi:MAG: MFS transporter [Gammaproteobacteria bacterium]